ncbi:hypothetical protein LTR08_007446 [Meristemomyces frigidus]|nr:hypothetical protein LTR08_007446 [Meristemomyces frigidus]
MASSDFPAPQSTSNDRAQQRAALQTRISHGAIIFEDCLAKLDAARESRKTVSEQLDSPTKRNEDDERRLRDQHAICAKKVHDEFMLLVHAVEVIAEDMAETCHEQLDAQIAATMLQHPEGAGRVLLREWNKTAARLGVLQDRMEQVAIATRSRRLR